MNLERHYNDRQLRCVKHFLADLTNDFKSISYREITKRYFKNSRTLADFCLKDSEHGLESIGMIEVRRHERTYFAGKFTGIQNEYRLLGANEEPEEPKIISFNGRFIVFEQKHLYTFRECLRITKNTFGSIPSKQSVVEECLMSGLSKDMIDYIWQEHKIDDVINKINSSLK